MAIVGLERLEDLDDERSVSEASGLDVDTWLERRLRRISWSSTGIESHRRFEIAECCRRIQAWRKAWGERPRLTSPIHYPARVVSQRPTAAKTYPRGISPIRFTKNGYRDK